MTVQNCASTCIKKIEDVVIFCFLVSNVDIETTFDFLFAYYYYYYFTDKNSF